MMWLWWWHEISEFLLWFSIFAFTISVPLFLYLVLPPIDYSTKETKFVIKLLVLNIIYLTILIFNTSALIIVTDHELIIRSIQTKKPPCMSYIMGTCSLNSLYIGNNHE